MAKHDGEVKIVAGGTDLLPSMKQKLFTPPYVLDLRGVGELRGIRELSGGGVEIGALTTLSAIEHSALIRKRLSGSLRRGENRSLAGIAQHGNDWREHLPRYSLPLVQPVAAMAKELRLLSRKKTATCVTLRRVESSAGRPFRAIRLLRCCAWGLRLRLRVRTDCGVPHCQSSM